MASPLDNFTQKVEKSREMGQTDTQILDFLRSRNQELASKIDKSRSLYDKGGNIKNDRDLVNMLSVRFGGSMPKVASVPEQPVQLPTAEPKKGFLETIGGGLKQVGGQIIGAIGDVASLVDPETQRLQAEAAAQEQKTFEMAQEAAKKATVPSKKKKLLELTQKQAQRMSELAEAEIEKTETSPLVAFGENIIESAKSRAQKQADVQKEFGKKEIFLPPMMQTTNISALGQLAGFGGDVIGEVLGAGYKMLVPKTTQQGVEKKVVEFLGSDTGKMALSAVQAGGEMWNKFKEEHPREAVWIESSANIAEFVSPFKAAKPVKGAVQKSVKTAVKTAEKLAKETRMAARVLADKRAVAVVEKVVKKNEDALTSISNSYKGLREITDEEAKRGFDVLKTISRTDMLEGAVDNKGVVRTMKKGGAVERLGIDEADSNRVVSDIIKKEGKRVSLSDLEKRLLREVEDSRIVGKEKTAALNEVRREIDGFRLDADTDGTISLEKIQDAKILKGRKLDYADSAEEIADKAMTRAYKKTIEEVTESFEVKDLNEEISKIQAIRKFLTKMDGARVEGGRLGGYAARAGGMAIGSILGSLGGGAGAAIGAFAGQDLALRLQRRALQRVFSQKTGLKLPKSKKMKEAIEYVKESAKQKEIELPTQKQRKMMLPPKTPSR